MKNRTKRLFTALRARNWGRLVGPTIGASMLVVLLTGLQVIGAGASTTPTTFYACVNMNNGTIYMVNAGDTCKNNYTLMSWNQVGPQGPQGPAGPQGPQGPQGPAGTTQTLQVRVVTSPLVDIPTGQNGEALAHCPAGTIVTGGGFSMLDIVGVVTESVAILAQNMWLVDVFNPNGSVVSLQAIAVCASLV